MITDYLGSLVKKLICAGDKEPAKNQLDISPLEELLAQEPGLRKAQNLLVYQKGQAWMFDDQEKGLIQEPFVGDTTGLIDAFTSVIPNAKNGFYLFFADTPFKGYNSRLTHLRTEDGWSEYVLADNKTNAQLCPNLMKYFDSPPRRIYFAVRPKKQSKKERFIDRLQFHFDCHANKSLRAGVSPNAAKETKCEASQILAPGERCLVKISNTYQTTSYYLTNKGIIEISNEARRIINYSDITGWRWIREIDEPNSKSDSYARFILYGQQGQRVVLENLGNAWMPFHKSLRELNLI